MPDETENQAEYSLERRLRKFNQEHWEEALAGVFARAATDEQFRHLCLTNARAAVHEVAPDLDLPADLKVVFVNKSEDVVHTYVLPTLLPTQSLYHEGELRRYTKEVLDSYTYSWTGAGTPHQTGKDCNPGGGNGGQGQTP